MRFAGLVTFEFHSLKADVPGLSVAVIYHITALKLSCFTSAFYCCDKYLNMSQWKETVTGFFLMMQNIYFVIKLNYFARLMFIKDVFVCCKAELLLTR